MKRYLIVVFLLLLIGFTGVEAKGGNEKIGSKLMKKLDSSSSLGSFSIESEEKLKVFIEGDTDFSQYGEVIEKFNDGYLIEVEKSKINEIVNDNDVKHVELDDLVKKTLSNTRVLVNSTLTNQQIVSGQNLSGKGVTVCVVDTGIDYTHPDLGGCTSSEFTNGTCGKVIAGYDYVNNDNNPIDDEGHGTHVAGIVAANGTVKGMAPDAKLAAVKVLDSGGRGLLSDVASGIQWCSDNSAAYNISVITMSLGTDDLHTDYCDNVGTYSDIKSAVSSAVSKNITVIAATGNDNSATGIASPSCLRNVTPITSSTKQDVLSSFSNRNSLVSIIAPGTSIVSTYIGSTYATASGTSMATPHAAGVLALIKQKYSLVYGKNSTSFVPIEALNKSGKQITSGSFTFYRINAFNATNRITNLTNITITKPLNNTSISGNYLLVANLSDTEFAENATFYFTNSSGTYVACTNTTGGRNFSCSWNSATTTDSNVNITVNASNYELKVNSTNSNITIDNTPPRFGIRGTNITYYHVNESALFYANWTDTDILDSGILVINSSNYSTVQMSSNWTNFTWSGNIQAGTNVSWYIIGNDSAGNTNRSMSSTNFTVWGWANATDYSLSENKTRGTTALECKIMDANFSTPIASYNVSFYNSSGYLGSNVTNSSGVATYYWNTSNHYLGNKSVTCLIDDREDVFYNKSYSNFTTSFILKGTPTSTILSPTANSEFFVGANVSFNSTTLQDNSSSITILSAGWYNSSSNISDTSQIKENFTWTIPINYTVGLQNITLNVTSDSSFFVTGLKNVTIAIYGYSEIHGNETSLAAAGSASRLSCGVRNNNSLVSVANYNVSFYEGSAHLGSNVTNSSGKSNLYYTFSSAGNRELTCSITNSSTTYYNASSTSNITWNVTISAAPSSGGGGGGGGGSGDSGGGSSGGGGSGSPSSTTQKKYNLKISVEDLEIKQGENKTIVARLNNVEDGIEIASLYLENIPSSWYEIGSYRKSMQKQDTQTVEIKINVPQEAEIGIYAPKLVVSSKETLASYEFSVNVKLSEKSKEVAENLAKTLSSILEKISSIDYISNDKVASETISKKIHEAEEALSKGQITQASQTIEEVDDYLNQIQANQIRTMQKERQTQMILIGVGSLLIGGTILFLTRRYLKS